MNANMRHDETDRVMLYIRVRLGREERKIALTINKIAPFHYVGKIDGLNYTFNQLGKKAFLLVQTPTIQKEVSLDLFLGHLSDRIVEEDPNLSCFIPGQKMFFWGVEDPEERIFALKSLFPGAEIAT